MMLNLSKINFKQPKYIFPLVMAIPFGCVLYFTADLIGSLSKEEEKPSDFINTELPEPQINDSKDKMELMQRRYQVEDAFGAVDGFDKEDDSQERLDDEDGNGYSEDEARRILEQQTQQQELEQQADEAERRIKEMQDAYVRNQRNNDNPPRDSQNSYEALEEYQRRRNSEVKRMIQEPDYEELQRAERERLAREEAEKKAKESEPLEVIKEKNLSHRMFNTVSNAEYSDLDTPLIKAIIDQTTKTTDGTRLRFQLLDDVIVDNYRLKKGTYLYGTVSGFGNQRVKAQVSSILVGDKFMKVNLNVYDLDGMEGFYVPASSFRDFLQNAAAGVANQQIQINQGTHSGNGIDGEMLALQTIQNVYQSLSSAISGNIRKNKAKIKYNTIVYLINSK